MPFTEELDKDLHILRDIFENSLAPMVITDAKLELPGPRFIYVNNAFEQMTGYTKKELQDKTPRILQGERSDLQMLAKLKQTLSKGEFFTGQTVNYTKQGKEYHVEWTISPIKDKKGEVKYFFSIQKDITQRELLHQKEQELFYQQSRLAAVGEMVDAVAHQFKQPLGIINLKAQQLDMNAQLDETVTAQDIEQTTKGIYKQITHMSETIDEFRSFFVQTKQKKPVLLYELLESVLVLTKDELIKNTIDIKIEGKDTIKKELYVSEFKHLLLNLINNAKDALVENIKSDRQIRCIIKEEQNKTKVLVCDNAGGIDEAIIDKIFEPRFTTKASGKGSGIGLYLSKKIADKVATHITVHNQPQGACFTLTIPHKGE